MDTTRFSISSPGRLVPIQWEGNRDHAFVPAHLPPQWDFDPILWPLVVEARSQLALLEGVGRRLPNPKLLLRTLSTREAIQSSRIEGTYATPRELLLFEKAPDGSGEQRQRSLEVHNYQRALDLGVQHSLPLSLRLVRDLHRTLMTGVRGGDRTPGEFRRVQVGIGDNRRFVPPPAGELPELLDALEKYLHREQAEHDPLIDCFLVHYQFETIHPFQDGNGRVGRLLLSLMVQQRCGMTKPWLYLSDYFEQNRRDYVQNLFEVSRSGDWTSWVRFCLNATVNQARDTVRRCERLLNLQDRYLERTGGSKKRARMTKLVHRLFDDPFVGISELSADWKVYYQTAQSYLEELESEGIVKELPNYQPRTFYAPEIWAVAYEDLGSIEQ